MRILFVAAVDFELDVARKARPGTDDLFLCTGMGPEATARALRELPLRSGEFDLAVDLGVAGSYGGRLPAGSVVQVVSEVSGGREGSILSNPAPPGLFDFLPRASGNTVPSLDPQYRCPEADVESMEGAAFFEVCLEAGIPFAEIRSVSNTVGEADRSRWDIPLALAKLHEALSLTFRNK